MYIYFEVFYEQLKVQAQLSYDENGFITWRSGPGITMSS